MKVLWFSVTPISLNEGDNTGVEGKGWISSLLQTALGIEGLQIVVAYENYSPVRKETEEKGGLKIVPINICRYSKRQIIKDMMTYKEVDEFILSESLRIVSQEKPDLIHVFGTEWCFGLLTTSLSMLTCHVNIPVVIHIQGLWSQIRNCRLLPGQSSLSDRLRPELLTHPLGMFAQYQYYNLSLERSRREEEIIRGNRYFMCRTRWDKAVVCLYRPDARIFHMDEALRQEFMERTERWAPRTGDGRRTVITTTGACYAIKGPDVVLKTARLLRENTDYEIEWRWIGGTDEEMREFEKLTGIRASEVGVRMMGTLSATEMIERLMESDMYVHTSYCDNSPNAVCEAQALGLPVIATDAGGTVSLFSPQYDRDMIVPANDPYYLASKIRCLREDKEKARLLSEENWRTAHERHDRKRIATQLEEIYREICG